MVDTMLHDSPDVVIHRTQTWAVWRPQVGRKKKFGVLDAAVQLLHVCGAVCGALSCWNKVVTRHSAYAGSSMTSRREAESKKLVRYHQNCVLCNNNKITACIADLFNSFCEEVYAVAFFKVLQQQTIGEVGNLIMRLWADNLYLQQGPVF